MPNFYAMEEQQAQNARIGKYSAELVKRSPSRWATIRDYAHQNPYNTGVIESLLLDALGELDRQDEQRMYADLRMGL